MSEVRTRFIPSLDDLRKLLRRRYSVSTFFLVWWRTKHPTLLIVIDRPPILYLEGNTTFGTGITIRGRQTRPELGAARGGELVIGNDVFINHGCSIVATVRISIGDHCLIGDYCSISDSSYHQVAPNEVIRREPITIGRNVWLGRNVIVLPGVSIGEHSVVAAGSTVSHDVPPRTLVAGSPARVIRSLTIPDEWERK
jgi:acetyltransferase-like isoleucine patch superfamily enzyme